MVECTGLENRRTLTRTVGSNPTSSAIVMKIIKRFQLFVGAELFLSPILSPKNYWEIALSSN